MKNTKFHLKKRIGEIAERAITGQVFPGCAIGVTYQDKQEVFCFGHHSYGSSNPLVTEDTRYDWASITKSINALVALIMISQGKLHLHDKVKKYLPNWFAGERADDMTIEHLLSNQVMFDLPAAILERGYLMPAKEYLDALISSSLRYAAGSKFDYTNLASFVLGFVLQVVAKKDFLSEVFESYLFSKLEIHDTFFNPFSKRIGRERIAPTEGECHGVVHDRLARHLPSPIATAGLFGTIGDAMKVGAFMSGDGSSPQGDILIDPELFAQMRKDRVKDGSSSRHNLVGHMVGCKYLPKSAAFCEEATFMLGFTGTMIASHAESGISISVLANPIHPARPRADRDGHMPIWYVRNDIIRAVLETCL